jgi:streptogramin lyase
MVADSLERFMRAGEAVAVCVLLVLAGCGGEAPVVSNVVTPIAPLTDVGLTGVVSSGSQPMVGAHVYLLAAGTTGYGGNGITAGNVSVSVVSAAETGTSDVVGAYVVAGSSGGFSLTGDYACTAGQQLYLYALGGNSGSGVNSAAGMLAAIGACPSSGSAAIFATVNEVSTVAAAYAMAGFATDAVHVSSSGTALALVGVANAFANAGNLTALGTGMALTTTAAGNGVAPQMEIDTLANVLAGCVNSAASCSTLLATATADGTSTGAKPTDTASAAINIAHHPGANVAAIYGMGSAAVFSPQLTAQPNDFTVGLRFSPGGLLGTEAIAIDGSGNAWVPNFNGGSVVELSHSGAVLSGASGYPSGGLSEPSAIAIDTTGNVWMSGEGAQRVTELSGSGALLSGSGGYTGGGLSDDFGIALDGYGNAWVGNGNIGSVIEFSASGAALTGVGGIQGGALSYPYSVAIDGSENVWVTNFLQTGVTKISTVGGTFTGTAAYYGGGMTETNALAIDGSGNVWVANDLGIGSSVTELSSSGSILSGSAGYSGGGLNNPHAIAIDGAGNVWVASFGGNNIVELSNSGSILSGVGGYQDGFSGPDAIAVDGSGDVWMTSGNSSNTVTELVGAGVPVVTPLAVGVKSNMLGTRP